MCIADAEAISLNARTAMVVRKGGTLWMVGKNDYGEFGDGTTDRRKVTKYFKVKTISSQ